METSLYESNKVVKVIADELSPKTWNIICCKYIDECDNDASNKM